MPSHVRRRRRGRSKFRGILYPRPSQSLWHVRRRTPGQRLSRRGRRGRKSGFWCSPTRRTGRHVRPSTKGIATSYKMGISTPVAKCKRSTIIKDPDQQGQHQLSIPGQAMSSASPGAPQTSGQQRDADTHPVKTPQSGPGVSGVLVGFPGCRQGNGHFPLADVNAAGSPQKAPVMPPSFSEEVRGEPRLSRWFRECPPGPIGKGAGSSARPTFHTPLQGLIHCFTLPCS